MPSPYPTLPSRQQQRANVPRGARYATRPGAQATSPSPAGLSPQFRRAILLVTIASFGCTFIVILFHGNLLLTFLFIALLAGGWLLVRRTRPHWHRFAPKIVAPPTVLSVPALPAPSQTQARPLITTADGAATVTLRPDPSPQMINLGTQVADRLPKAALFTSWIIAEEPLGSSPHACGLMCLLEEALAMAPECAVLIITFQEHVDTSAFDAFPRVYHVCSQEAYEQLAVPERSRCTSVIDRAHLPAGRENDQHVQAESNVSDFCQALVEHGDKVIWYAGSYADRSEAARVLHNIIFSLYHFTRSSARRCIIVLPEAHRLLPDLDPITVMRQSFFASLGDAVVMAIRTSLLQLIAHGPDDGLYPYLATPTLSVVRAALLHIRIALYNKIPLAEELPLLGRYFKLGQDHLAAMGFWQPGFTHALLRDMRRSDPTHTLQIRPARWLRARVATPAAPLLLLPPPSPPPPSGPSSSEETASLLVGAGAERLEAAYREEVGQERGEGGGGHSSVGVERQQPLLPMSLPIAQREWHLPSLSGFHADVPVMVEMLSEETAALARIIAGTLRSFRVDAEVREADISIGPTVIRFGIRPTGKPEMTQDDKGRLVPVRDGGGNVVYETRTRVSRIMALQNDLALVLEAKTIRMEAPVPGRPYVGVEIPNKNSRLVTLREVLESKEYQTAKAKSKLAVALGRDVAGSVRVGDLSKMPHLLIAGATGAGKSVMINVIIASLLFAATPEDVRLLMVDPKMVELSLYNGIPHLLMPVVTEVEKVVPLLRNAIGEMERRYRLFSQVGVRNLDGYRKLRAEKLAKGDTSLANMPAIVIIIDELADLMMAAPEEVEGMICRLAQLARATGMHLVVATQRPSVDVITGLIKANIPTRISFMVSSLVDSRTIIDMGGAERLLGRGDMLYLPADAGRPERIQGAYLADDEVETLVLHWRQQFAQKAPTVRGASDVPLPTAASVQQLPLPPVEPGWEIKEEPEEGTGLDDELLDQAEEVVRDEGRASISLLQRRLRVGYARAARLIDLLEEHGIIGPSEQGGRSREVFDNDHGRFGQAHSMADEVADIAAEEKARDEFLRKQAERTGNLPEAIAQGVSASQECAFTGDDEVEDDEGEEEEALPVEGLDERGDEAGLARETSPYRDLFLMIAQGAAPNLDGRSLPLETKYLLFAAYILRQGSGSLSLKVLFRVSESTARTWLSRLEQAGILLPHDGTGRPRQLTPERGGAHLSPDLRAVRDFVDHYRVPSPSMPPVVSALGQPEP